MKICELSHFSARSAIFALPGPAGNRTYFSFVSFFLWSCSCFLSLVVVAVAAAPFLFFQKWLFDCNLLSAFSLWQQCDTMQSCAFISSTPFSLFHQFRFGFCLDRARTPNFQRTHTHTHKLRKWIMDICDNILALLKICDNTNMLNSSLFRFHCAPAQNFHEWFYILFSSVCAMVLAVVFIRIVVCVTDCEVDCEATANTNKMGFSCVKCMCFGRNEKRLVLNVYLTYLRQVCSVGSKSILLADCGMLGAQKILNGWRNESSASEHESKWVEFSFSKSDSSFDF